MRSELQVITLNTLRADISGQKYLAQNLADVATPVMIGDKANMVRIPAKLNSHSGQREHPDP